MLYDPKWEVEVRTDPFSLESLIAWLEKMPAEGYYKRLVPRQCLLGQWIRAADIGLTEDELGAKSLGMSLAAPFDKIALTGPPIFGDALLRARAAVAP